MVRSAIVLPELTEAVANYLEQVDLANCVQVCKAWSEVFTPLLYHHVQVLTSSHGMFRAKTPWEALQKHSSHVRTITVTTGEFPSLELWGSDCRNLTALYLGPLQTVFQRSLWCSRLMVLIANNPSIHTLKVYLYRDLARDILHQYKALKHLPALKNLLLLKDPSTRGSYWSDVAFQEILEGGHRLENLVCDFQYGGTTSLDTTMEETIHHQMWTEIKSLQVYDQIGSRAIELAQRCPNLTRLNVKLMDYYNKHCSILQQMTRHFQSGHLSRLEHLEISGLDVGSRGGGGGGGGGSVVESTIRDFLRVCASTTALKTFCLDGFYVSDELLTELWRYHAGSLENLSIMEKKGLQSSNVLQALSSCPNLRLFKGRLSRESLYLEDLVRSPWICKDLRVLHLVSSDRIELDDEMFASVIESPADTSSWPRSNIAWQRQVWAQIGALKNLETLHLSIHNEHCEIEIFSFSNGGMEHILGLKRLTELGIPEEGKESFMNNQDKQDLMQRRPRLRILYI